jgi:hypothetical protein
LEQGPEETLKEIHAIGEHLEERLSLDLERPALALDSAAPAHRTTTEGFLDAYDISRGDGYRAGCAFRR